MLSSESINLLNSFNKLAFAVSGGKDSMALLHFALHNIEKKKIIVVTVHHNLRGDEGKRDRDFVVNYCKENGLECLVYEEQIKEFCAKNGYTIEQGARIRRRAIFEQIVNDKIADRVVLAHHKDDQIESILMHIFRGSGLKGLCGMEIDTGKLIRPMLDIPSKKIMEYIKENHIDYVQDSTNFELEYSRNKIRNVVIKDIESAYPNFGDNLIRLSEISNEAVDYIRDNTPEYIKTNDGLALKIDEIKEDNIVSKQAIINAIEAVSTRVDLEQRHINSVHDLISKENGKSIDLPFGVKATKEYDLIVFSKQSQEIVSQIEFNYGTYQFGDWLIEISMENNGGLRLDMDKANNAVIRTRQTGDSFKKFKGGRKNLGDYFTDIKVPKRIRDQIPVVAIDNEILVVISYEISDLVSITNETKNIAYISSKKIK